MTDGIQTLEDLVKLGSHNPNGEMNTKCPCGDWIKTPDAGQPCNTCSKCGFRGVPGRPKGEK